MVSVKNLTCESLTDPLGISTMNPHFSWLIETDMENAVQEKYHIEVTDEDNGLIWDSGEIDSSKSVLVEYQGQSIEFATRYFFSVRVQVNSEWSKWSKKAWFETSLEKWNAGFICADDKPEESIGKTFKKDITLSKPVKCARLYATALGLYECFLNGKPVSDTCFNPGWSSYGKRLLYQVYDITNLLLDGENELKTYLGAGWYKGDLGFKNCRNIYGDKMAFSAQIDIVYADGSSETIFTDEDWQYADSPIVYSEIYNGETYDARMETPSLWKNASLFTMENVRVEAFDGVPVKRQEILKPIKLFTTPKGERVLDFGQNLTGRVRFIVKGTAGDKVVLRHAEVLDKDGNFYTENLRSAKATDEYILKGGEIEVYEPFFTFHGFRFVCVDEYPGEINLENFQAIVTHSNLERIGVFSCSNQLINQLQSNITWGLKGNFLDIPTDCPQRDERLGWTGDAQIFISTASYLYNVLPFFRKWLHDLALDQRPDGGVPFVIPDLFNTFKGDPNIKENHSSCGWGDAAVIIPWTLYECFGDERLILEQYPSMKVWVEYIRSQANGNLWNTGFHFADWVALDAKEGSYIGATPRDLCATAYYAYSTELVAKAANLIGELEDAKNYSKLHADIAKAYQDEFFTNTGRLAARTQTAHILSLMFGLTPDKFIHRTVETLVKLIEENDGHLVTGFLGTPYFCHALSQNNRLLEAYALLEREDYPSWLYQVKMGATTVWEHLDGIKPDGSMWSADMNSFNHYAYGAIGDFIYKVVAGINHLEAGYKRILIAPKPGGSLTWAKAELNTPYGLVCSHWKLEDGKFTLNVKIPPNTTAEIELPNGERYEIGSGEYVY
ncbi:MAG: glycoside hydrolase family 78 protein [Oscillospiraceae bacterium]|nr:glycoside hydrolase family 78 protein [Oscillospiraceae bacterium]